MICCPVSFYSHCCSYALLFFSFNIYNNFHKDNTFIFYILTFNNIYKINLPNIVKLVFDFQNLDLSNIPGKDRSTDSIGYKGGKTRGEKA